MNKAKTDENASAADIQLDDEAVAQINEICPIGGIGETLV